jgi:4-hydroxybenzoate polyprenyltransferase
MRYLRLFIHMTRYRSALVLVLFMMLSTLVHDDTGRSLFSWQAVVMGLCLVLVYTCATCVNDLADWKIDLINLKGHADRPLVTGENTRRDLVILAITCTVTAIALASFIGIIAVYLVVAGLFFNTIYSLKPFQISHHAILTPFYLAFCYVFTAYGGGYAVVSARNNVAFNIAYFAAFYLLFLGRISLKDFRDRKGDAAAGKPTLILKYGKRAVVMLSAAALVAGSVMLAIAMQNYPFMWAVIGIFTIFLLTVEYKLWTSKKELLELLSVGYGARIGNGLLFAALGTMLLMTQHAQMSDIALFYVLLIGIYVWMFWQYIQSPELFYFGKRKIKT